MSDVRYTEAPARRAELLRRLEIDGYVSSTALANELGVSEMTIRRDLRRLQLDGSARRVIGGATGGIPFAERNRAASDEKRAIAAACARLLTDAATVALDAGTTVAPLPALLEPGTTVVTHSVPVITACAARDDLELIGLGGSYQPDTRSFTGPAAEHTLDTLSVDVAVLSATAVDSTGLLCANALDAALKRRMAAIATRRILLVDSGKLSARAPIRFGTLDLVDVVVTDARATPDQLALLASGGAEVVTA
ncbi:DeoR family fructose operon transcriptional repressor [Diaminobutyricimonas aerilata]|uniref:DeoR family fructose operon transcriptional repressor n=1 Tax=Diaminobutyricimonas aerilata TaxID=1162967 RepID=A0A2M9CLW7_9MICO|nr:DeoR/GlpR family DNA-binding transcription regulator [Diaminobutyricimonas aerilata]PJJ72868.1 DeoR family fructose operon transcriptional repressor [Diaminobutyricimonas aerilata]